jgi:peptidase MA superfamily protein
VVLLMGTAFQEGGAPEWAAGINDGTIRVPVQGLETPTPRLLRVLRHELAHSFIAARTGGNCPTWLQEGISQWLEGGDPARQDAMVTAAAVSGRLLPLLTLEAPFQTLPATDVPLAYAESLSAVAHILRRSGEAGVGRLLASLGDRLPSEEALPVALALSYPEFQKSWEAHLRRGGAPARRSERDGAPRSARPTPGTSRR